MTSLTGSTFARTQLDRVVIAIGFSNHAATYPTSCSICGTLDGDDVVAVLAVLVSTRQRRECLTEI